MSIAASSGAEEMKGRTKRKSSGPPSKPPTAPILVLTAPRVDLLPPEIKAQRKARGVRHLLVYVVAGALVLVILGSVGATALAESMKSSVVDAQQQTATILSQQKQFIKAQDAQRQVALLKAAQTRGASTEIDWSSYIDRIQAALPAGVLVAGFNIKSASPFEVFEQPSSPLQGLRVATVDLQAVSAEIPDLADWVTALSALPGYSDAIPGTTSRDDTTGLYLSNVTLHLNSAAFDGRFAEKGK
ncbi:hypothetical protein [Leifsonia shinshuensis]|uniref:hypothetical protein n=1 Tax=Leifsonia shinshuensis TaxID=150026 RepID=UPI00286711AB|nr:hypothetical protein [Leifsonia shinshuensis]MDR6971503.1 hypothetical protein [Leifsonia shinshuensis]